MSPMMQEGPQFFTEESVTETRLTGVTRGTTLWVVNMADFPSLVVTAQRVRAQGAFAESQAEYLDPDRETVKSLDELLRVTRSGVVAHYYMDPELQGVLNACTWPHVSVSDSLVMARGAVDMARAGVEAVWVLGVDFMSENVRALMDHEGFAHVPVYRLSESPIGCTLAASAEAPAYDAWLRSIRNEPQSLHVIYINTSLRTKARSHRVIPTLACTSSNVLKSILQADVQVPGVKVFYGPDTYMGANLKHMLTELGNGSDAQVKKIHTEHSARSVRALAERMSYFRQGHCVVHHLFGDEVVRRIEAQYAQAHVTAHLEVPGAMFDLGLRAQREGRGVVGSTSDILRFITHTVDTGEGRDLQFVLGTEAGMVTSIVRRVQERLRTTGGQVEIVFPVASESITATGSQDLLVVPGSAGGEGCGVEGGCATCPYMKMNSLEALEGLLTRIAKGDHIGTGFEPTRYDSPVGGESMVELGTEPIIHMEYFRQWGTLPSALVNRVTGSGAP